MRGVKNIYRITKLNRDRKVKNDAYLSFSQCHRVIEIYVFLRQHFCITHELICRDTKFFLDKLVTFINVLN